ncbi:MAG: SUMF1/EgtB/PvdO family nonheme iron enzyme [Opitutales bacterium]
MTQPLALFFIFYFWIGMVRLCALDPISSEHFNSSPESNQSGQAKFGRIGKEKIRLFDDSELSGYLIGLDAEENLFWQNKSVSGKISFDYKSVSNIIFNRSIPPAKDAYKKLRALRLFFKNGDKLRCNFIKLTKSHLWVETGFTEPIQAPIDAIQKLEFLPATYESLFDPSMGLKEWKSSNSKSWSDEDGDFVSVFSGSTGTLLPRKDVLEIEFEAEWERSLYLALRIFSDSDGSSYGNVGYHLSFSNSRINLQANKRKKGRIIRETLGTLMVKEMMDQKKARISVLAHRGKKEFIIFVNGRQVAQWKDASQDFHPDANGILFINQGGNSYIRLKEVNIAGWDGSFFPSEEREMTPPPNSNYAVFKNGDSTTLDSISGKENLFSIATKRGAFSIPLPRIKSVHFNKDSSPTPTEQSTEQILLTHSLGQISCKILSISKEYLNGIHPDFGQFKLSLETVKQMKCNQHLLRLRKYFEELAEVKKALNNQKPEIALSILNLQPTDLRSWYWSRLSFLAKGMQSEEILSFSPHPEKGLFSASFAGNEDAVLTLGKNGKYALWSGHAKLASGSFSDPAKFPAEVGRLSNEAQHAVTLTKPYWIGDTEVTQEQYELVTSQNPSLEKNSSFPVVCSWFDAQDFCKALNKKHKPPAGYEWRLPTEAEWEWACRAGSNGPFCESTVGPLNHDEELAEKHLDRYGWFAGNSGNKIHSVKQKLPNAFGLYDMHGNVWEWCLDSTQSEKAKILEQRVAGKMNPFSTDGDWKILRGGCYDVKFDRCRSAYRGANAPSIVQGDRGFRIALGPILDYEGNSTKSEMLNKTLNVEKFKLTLVPISSGTFLMGSPDILTAPHAMTRAFGNELITGSSDGTLGITDFSGQPIEKLADLNSSITSMDATSDKKWILAGCANGNVHLVDGQSFQLERTLSQHTFAVTSTVFAPNGESFSTSGLDGKFHSYRLPKTEKKWTVYGSDHNTSFDFLEYNSDSSKILTSGLGVLPKLFDAESGKEIKLNTFPYIGCVRSRFLPNEESFVSVTKSGLLLFTETTRGLVYKIVRLNLKDIIDFSFSPYGKRIIISTKEGLCSVRKTPVTNNICIQDETKNLEQSPDFFFALADKTEPYFKKLPDFLSGLDHPVKPDFSKKGCRLSPDKKLVLTTLDGALRLWCFETGEWVSTLGDKFASSFIECGFSPDGKFIVAKLKTKEILIYPTGIIHSTGSTNPHNFEEIEKWF